MTRKTLLTSKALIVALSLLLSSWSFAQGGAVSRNQVNEDPSAMAMVADLVFIRPVMLGITAVGSALWVASLPFSIWGGNAKQAGDTLVLKPATNTFVRCLGCTRAGYKHEVSERDSD